MLVCASRDGLFYPSCTITVSQHDSSVLFVIGVSGSLIEAVKRSARVSLRYYSGYLGVSCATALKNVLQPNPKRRCAIKLQLLLHALVLGPTTTQGHTLAIEHHASLSRLFRF